MAFTNRNRNASDIDSKLDEFASAAEPSGNEPLVPELTAEERAKKRAEGRRFAMYTVRGTEGQDKLIKYASEKLGISQNELYLRYILTPLEEGFGAELPVK